MWKFAYVEVMKVGRLEVYEFVEVGGSVSRYMERLVESSAEHGRGSFLDKHTVYSRAVDK